MKTVSFLFLDQDGYHDNIIVFDDKAYDDLKDIPNHAVTDKNKIKIDDDSIVYFNTGISIDRDSLPRTIDNIKCGILFASVARINKETENMDFETHKLFLELHGFVRYDKKDFLWKL